MQRFLLVICACLIGSTLFFSPLNAKAAPKEEEVDSYLKEIGWTRKDLDKYLAFYEVSLDDFKDINHLQDELGTPINEENLLVMLETYDLTKEELEVLLSRFGEKVQDYTFIEDLEIAVDFYMTHEEEVARAEDFLVSMGFEAEEARQIFRHILSLPKDVLAKELERLQGMLDEEPNSVEKVFSLWTEFMEVFRVEADLHVEDGSRVKVSQEVLMQPGWLEGKVVHLDLFDKEGSLLASAVMDEQIVAPSYVQSTGKELIHLGQVGVKMSDELYSNRMPNTSSLYGVGMLAGLGLVVVAGGAMLMLNGARRVRKG
ncbi:processed acidic surface protein [Sutcliffiella horikoshii]|uniref:processed acidic surface protein n=1 Tax=Sutcliffiella horikoshii TaxID=79883 RepID=UPI00384BB408